MVRTWKCLLFLKVSTRRVLSDVGEMSLYSASRVVSKAER